MGFRELLNRASKEENREEKEAFPEVMDQNEM